MIQFHVLESAMRPSDRPAVVPTPERVNPLDDRFRHLAESVLDVVRKETFAVDIGQDGGLTVAEYESLLDWLCVTLEQHVHELASADHFRRSSSFVSRVDRKPASDTSAESVR